MFLPLARPLPSRPPGLDGGDDVEGESLDLLDSVVSSLLPLEGSGVARSGSTVSHSPDRPVVHPDYELERMLGSGGQAEVYLAHHRTLGRRVAIKFLRSNQDESMARRMLQEARLLARLRHPNLVQVFDAGRAEDGRPYIILEYIDGEPLGRLLRAPWPVADALELVWQVAMGLAAAHRAGVVHRDVKLQNILLEDRSGLSGARFCARLVDFGVARPPVSTETVVGTVIGTVGYMGPEVYDGQSVPASDIHALGVVLYRLLSGERSSASKVRQALRDETGSRDRTAWSPELTQLLRDMLAEDPQQRPRDGAALLTRLECLTGWDPSSRVTSARNTSTMRTEPLPPPRSVRGVVLGGVGLMALGGLLLLAALPSALLESASLQEQPSAVAADEVGADEPVPAVDGLRTAPALEEEPVRAAAADWARTVSGPHQGRSPRAKKSAEAPLGRPPPPAGSSAPPAASVPAKSPVPAKPSVSAESATSTTPPSPRSSTGSSLPEEARPEPPPASSGAGTPPQEDASSSAPSLSPGAASPSVGTSAAPGATAPDPESSVPSAEDSPSPGLPTGRFPGTIQGRSLVVTLSGTPTSVRAELLLQVGHRSQTHTLTGRAIRRGEGWHLQLSDSAGKWSLAGTLTEAQLTGSVSIHGRKRGRLDARRTP